MSEPIARRLVIHGRVQGVWFRESMRIEAEALGVTGWVRNCINGSVEAFVQGRPEAVRAMIGWAHRGPDRAEVTRVEETEEPAGSHARFEKHPTA